MATWDIPRPAELLEQLARDYHHVQQSAANEAPESAVRRRLHAEMERLAQRFERLLAFWASEEELGAAWRAHLRGHGPRPDQPEVAQPCLFRGETDSGTRVEIRPARGGGYDLIADGSRVEHQAVPWHLDPDELPPFRLGQFVCREVFEAPAEARAELSRTVAEPRGEPPWRWARALFEDGLIDSEFGLTPRGRRSVTPEREPAARAPKSCHCLVAADAGRARVLVLEVGSAHPGPDALVEVANLVNPARRARDAAVFSDNRPGLRREGGPASGHAVDDRRDSHRQEQDKRFAEQVAEEAAQVWRRYPACQIVVAAAPRMLGALRPALARRAGPNSPFDIRELDRDLTMLAPAALHDALADAEVLPPRERLPARRRANGAAAGR
jgi:protein required for attachment to host cells